IFGLQAAWLDRKTKVVDKSKEPSIVRYLKSNPQRAEYDDFPPLLYPDCVEDVRRTFRNPQLVKLMMAILYGQASLKVDEENEAIEKEGKDVPKRRLWTGPPPNAVKWGLKRVTPGMIAFAAVLATFVLSADDEFVMKGKETGINYWSRHQLYCQVLISTADDPSTKATFAFWQKKLFPRSGTRNGQEDVDEQPARETAAEAHIRRLRELQQGSPSQTTSTGSAAADPRTPAADDYADPSSPYSSFGFVDARNDMPVPHAAHAAYTTPSANTYPPVLDAFDNQAGSDIGDGHDDPDNTPTQSCTGGAASLCSACD
ncbi:hypothetical protein OH77DRAFT_1526237, partial [Trametes cingulata]